MQVENNPTRRQHYVPQEYLRRWCDANGCIAVSLDGRILPPSGTTVFAVERDFYEFIDLTVEELAYFFKAISQITTPQSPMHDVVTAPVFLNVLFYRCKRHDWSSQFAVEFDRFSALTIHEKHRRTYEFLRNVAEGRNSLSDEQIAQLEEGAASGFEELMTGIENYAWPVLNEILNPRIALKCLKDVQKLRYLLLYIVNQCLRGPDYLAHIEKCLPNEARELGGTTQLAKYLRYIYPFYVVDQLIDGRGERLFRLMKNYTQLEFVTSDSPCAVYGELGSRLPCITYFPLSPDRALLYGYKSGVNAFVQKYGWELRDQTMVHWLNCEVVANAIKFVFAKSAATLKDNDYHASKDKHPRYGR